MPSLAITWARRLKRVFNIDIAYMDVGKEREQDAVALKRAVNAVVPSRSPLLRIHAHAALVRPCTS